jgi:hypothetical protein
LVVEDSGSDLEDVVAPTVFAETRAADLEDVVAPTVFAETRAVAQEWVFSAVLTHHDEHHQAGTHSSLG